MADEPSQLALDFDPRLSLGFLVTDWIERHCAVPSGVYEGESLIFNGWQLYCAAHHYRIKPKAKYDPRRLVEPFTYRRSVLVGPQKSGKARGPHPSRLRRVSALLRSRAGRAAASATAALSTGAGAAGSMSTSLVRPWALRAARASSLSWRSLRTRLRTSTSRSSR